MVCTHRKAGLEGGLSRGALLWGREACEGEGKELEEQEGPSDPRAALQPAGEAKPGGLSRVTPDCSAPSDTTAWATGTPHVQVGPEESRDPQERAFPAEGRKGRK